MWQVLNHFYRCQQNYPSTRTDRPYYRVKVLKNKLKYVQNGFQKKNLEQFPERLEIILPLNQHQWSSGSSGSNSRFVIHPTWPSMKQSFNDLSLQVSSRFPPNFLPLVSHILDTGLSFFQKSFFCHFLSLSLFLFLLLVQYLFQKWPPSITYYFCFIPPPVANAMKVLQTCIYKSVKQAYFYNHCGHKSSLIQNYHAFMLKNLVLKSENSHHGFEFDKMWGCN